MTFGQLYFSFKGRINRSKSWLAVVLPLGLISMFVYILFLGLILTEEESAAKTGMVIYIVWCIIIIWPCLATQAKRWHDLDKSAWWILINFIPIVGGLWAFIELGFLKGTEGENRFGPDPLKK